MPTTLIITTSAPDRVSGYLRTIYLEIHPSAFISLMMPVSVSVKTFEILRGWHSSDGDWSAIMLVSDRNAPGHIRMETIGEAKKEMQDLDGLLCVSRNISY